MISLVIPLFNEAAGLPALSARLREYLPLIFEYTFEANRGRVMGEWEDFFAGRK